MTAKRGSALLLLVLALGAGLRAWHAASVAESYQMLEAGEEYYYEQGVAWLSRGVFSEGLVDGRPRAWRGPTFPAFAALTELPFARAHPKHLRWGMALLGAAGAGVAYLLAASLAGPLGGLLGAALFALDPGQALSGSSLNIHAFYGLLLLGLGALAAAWAQRPTPPRGAAFGAMLGVSLLARSTHMFAAPLLLLLGAWRGDGAGRALRRAAWPLLALGLVMAPWTARNAALFHRFLPLDLYSGAVNLYAAASGHDQSCQVEDAVALAEAERPGLRQEFLRERDSVFPVLLELGKGKIKAAPLRYARGVLRRMRALYGAWWPLLPLLALLLATRERAAWAASLTLLSLLAYPLVSVQADYAQAARPLAAALAGAALGRLWKAKRPKADGGLAPAPAALAAATASAALFFGLFAASALCSWALMAREGAVVARAGGLSSAFVAPSLDGRATSLVELAAQRAPRALGDLELGISRMDAGDAQGACAAYQRSWRADAGRLEAGARVADCLLKLGKAAESEAAARRLLALAAGKGGALEARGQAALARALAARKKGAEAARAWSSAAALYPDDAGLRRDAAASLLEAGRPADALPHARRLAELARDGGPAARARDLVLLARALGALGRKDEARAVLGGASGPGFDGLAAALRDAAAKGRLAEAASLADALVALPGDDAMRARAFVERARVRGAAKDDEGALADFNAAAALDARSPEGVDERLAWAALLAGRGRPQEGRAEQVLGDGLSSASGDARAALLVSRAALRFARGEASADADLAAALAAGPEAACLRPPSLAQPGRMPAAYFDACLAKLPGTPKLLADRGVALWRAGRKEEAVASLRAAVAADPADLAAALSLASAAPGPDSKAALRVALAASKDPAGSPLRRAAEGALR